MAFSRLTTLLILTAVAASGAFFATRLHKSVQPNGTSPRIVSLYNQFKSKFGRLRASPEEDNFRLRVFEKNVAFIEESNKNALGYSLAINDFADMEAEEVKAQYFGLGKITMADILKFFEIEKEEKKEKAAPREDYTDKYIDWSKDMHPIEHQKGCASCYAFATVAPLELNHFKKTGQKIRLSKQELVDCSSSFGNTGCRGGWMHQSYDYIKKRNGLSTEVTYPYMASQKKTCTRISERVNNLLSEYRQLPCDAPSEVAKHLQTTVVPSAIDVSGLMFYEKGVFSGSCPTNINHAVVIVGMGEENGQKYWKIRNSWGKSWGENGYLRIQRETKEGVMGKCGVTVYNVVPL